MSGGYIECAAYNPSLPPLQSAFVNLLAEGAQPDDIRAAVLVESEGAPVRQGSICATALSRMPDVKRALK